MNVREITLRLLDDYEMSGKYINLSLSSHIVDAISPVERAQVTSLLYTTVEHKLTFDYYIAALAEREIEKVDLHTRNILRLGMCQILYMSSLPNFAAVSETVKLGRHKGERSFVNGILRSLVRRKEDGTVPMPKREKNTARYLSVAYSFPLPIVKHFISLFGEGECESMLSSFNSECDTDITVNTTRISRDELMTLLLKSGFEVQPSPYSSLSLRLKGSCAPRAIPGFDEGYFFVQDQSCAISAEVLGTEIGDSVIDVCAAPGGKSFSAAILGGDKGRVISLDIHESKLSLIEGGAKRLGLTSITVGQRDACVPDESLFGKFDRVICDVPCSGFGVLGKKPDLRYRSIESLSRLPELQYSILSSASKYLKVGGTLVYSTCTLNPAENEEVVNRFLLANREYSPTDFKVGDLSGVNGTLTILPNKHGMDGFFIAKLKKETVKND
jgi:16S rRNA (cytosine967-C5)-methyltransferase